MIIISTIKKITFLLLYLQVTIIAQPEYVTTIHPFKEILKEVVGERGEVTALLPPGTSPHTYNLSPSEIKKITKADALFYGAEHLDEWAIEYENSNKIELLGLLPADSLLNIFSIKNEDLGVDPHFWTDPLIVKLLLHQLTAKLCEIDPLGCSTYKANAKKFSEELEILNNDITKYLKQHSNKAVFISHPFFQYFLKRYNFNLAGIIEPIPGKEPTPKDLKTLIDIASKKNVKAIFTHIQLPDKAGQLLSEATGIKLYALDPIGGTEGKYSYKEILYYNTGIILKALR